MTTYTVGMVWAIVIFLWLWYTTDVKPIYIITILSMSLILGYLLGIFIGGM